MENTRPVNSTCDIGLIGLGVMGRNLALNMNDKGYSVAVYNRPEENLLEEFLHSTAKNRKDILPTRSLPELVAAVKPPRKIMFMVTAGPPVDELIKAMSPLLSPSDTLIDGGNSHFADTDRRLKTLALQNIHYTGAGISGGEEGARHGPAIMPGGSREAWPAISPLLQDIAAQSPNGHPCCEWVGSGGAGHYVKMVHNGIEYAEMQLIAEAYNLLKDGLGLKAPETARVFRTWNQGQLESYLIEITAHIIPFPDTFPQPLLDSIEDIAVQKGTGKWIGINALELGIPATVISQAVFARYISALKDQRIKASQIFKNIEPDPHHVRTTLTRHFDGTESFIQSLEQALLATRSICYTQGFMLMRQAAREYGWELHPAAPARIWQGGCIIRNAFLEKITIAFETSPQLENLLQNSHFSRLIRHAQPHWRRIIAAGALAGIPLPAISSALTFFDSYTSPRLPANLIQAQRDYFGAHGYQRTDRPPHESFHTDWSPTPRPEIQLKSP